MPHLLLLPREIRDIIISLVVTTPALPPVDATVESLRSQLRDIKYQCWFGDNGVKYLVQMGSYRPNSAALLLTNHQLHDEVEYLLQKASVQYVLDVMLINERELWPTWTSIPILATQIDTVEVNFRIISQGQKGWSGFSSGSGGTPRIMWSFYSLLERFLKVGSSGFTERKSIDA